MKFVVDENVSLYVASRLKDLGHSVIVLSDNKYAGIKDVEVYNMAIKEKAILITRDHHFTNAVRFPTERTEGIIYIRYGNLRSDEEAALVVKFIGSYDLSTIKGQLITLYKDVIKIRPKSGD